MTQAQGGIPVLPPSSNRQTIILPSPMAEGETRYISMSTHLLRNRGAMEGYTQTVTIH